jgi:glycolate oxidase iron-sulfur subunit
MQPEKSPARSAVPGVLMSETAARVLEQEIDKLLACVHCGLCLSSCPTYLQLGDENDSPRGRLYLMRAVAEKKLPAASDAFRRHIDLCLGCRACETACPAGVAYGSLLEDARKKIASAGARKFRLEKATRFFLNHIFNSPQRLHLFLLPARFLRRRGKLIQLLLGSGLLPESAAKALRLLAATKYVPFAPSLAASEVLNDTPDRGSANSKQEPRRPQQSPREKVGLFEGCVTRELFAHTNGATVKVLENNACAVACPKGQACCGALHLHAGEAETARQLARRNIEAFESGEGEAIIVNVAGCGAVLKEYGQLLADDPDFARRAAAFASRVRDISEFLVEISFRPGPRRVPAKATYDAPCHLHHAQRITGAPLELLARVSGLQLVPLVESDACCGGAGVYNLLHAELADKILERKLEYVRQTGAEILLTGNAGCAMQIGSGLQQAGINVSVMHPVEILALTYD